MLSLSPGLFLLIFIFLPRSAFASAELTLGEGALGALTPLAALLHTELTQLLVDHGKASLTDLITLALSASFKKLGSTAILGVSKTN